MRKKDKLKNYEQANLMLEQSYLKSKGLLSEEGSAMKDFGSDIVNKYNLQYVENMDNVALGKEIKSKGLPKKGVISINKAMGNATVYLVTKEKEKANEIYNKFKEEYPKNVQNIEKEVNIGEGEEQIWLIQFTIFYFDKL